MTKEELLAEAKRRYKVGMLLKSAYDGDNYILENTNFRIGNLDYVLSHIYVYYKGKWAEIISSPEQKIIYNYLIL